MKDLDKEYQKTIHELIKKYNVKNDDEESIYKLLDEFYKKHKTFSNFEKSSNPKYINAIKKIKEEEKKRKKSVHYLLKVDPPTSKEIDYSNLDLTGSIINSDEKEKKLKKILESLKIKGNINSVNMYKKLDEEIDELGKKLENTLINEKNFYDDRDKNWENFKEDKNLKFNNKEDDEEKAKNLYIEMKLKEESMPNEDYKKFLDLLKAKKKFFYEKDPYITNYNNDIIYKSNKTLEMSKLDELGSTPFTLRLKEMAEKENIINEYEEEKDNTLNNVPKEYGKEKVKNATLSHVYKIFEKDFDNFIKEQYNG
jgi:hypothetical protein